MTPRWKCRMSRKAHISLMKSNHPAASNPAVAVRCNAQGELRRFVDQNRWAMRTRAFVMVGTAFFALGASPSCHGSEVRPVSITLQSVTLSNESWGTLVFSVTNSGRTPVTVASCGCSGIPTNVPAPLGAFGICKVPPLAPTRL